MSKKISYIYNNVYIDRLYYSILAFIMNQESKQK